MTRDNKVEDFRIQRRNQRLSAKKDNPGCLVATGLLLVGIGVFVLLTAGVIAILSVLLMLGWGLAAPFFGVGLLSFPEAFGIIFVLWIFSLVIGKLIK